MRLSACKSYVKGDTPVTKHCNLCTSICLEGVDVIPLQGYRFEMLVDIDEV